MSPSPPSGPCGAGSGRRGWPAPRARRASRPRPGRRPRTKPGNSTPRRRCASPTGTGPAGCWPSTKRAARPWSRRFSPLGDWSAVGAERTREALRALFADWGIPGGLRVDNGVPWGAAGGLPTDLALWLIGLGVAVHHNRPRRCQENGRVERTHGVLGAWAEPAACADAGALQTALTAACRVQRETYPAIRGDSRATAFPLLMCGGRPYDPAREAALFDERRVWDHLARRRWTRRVDKVGRISIYNRSLTVGRRVAGQDVALQFDPAAVAWVVRDARGDELARHPAPELARDRIVALTVSHTR